MQAMTPPALPVIPQVGTFATQQVGSDCYPFVVVWKSTTGAKLKLKRLQVRIVSGSFQTGNAVVEYWLDPDTLEIPAFRSKRGYLLAGSPLGLRGARFYQCPEF
jgi:hypothetical protein